MHRYTLAAACERYPRHSEATGIVRDDGSILLIWSRFEAGPLGTEDNAPASLVAAESRDGGLTWSAPEVVTGPRAGETNVLSCGLCRLPDGTVLLVYNRFPVWQAGSPLTTHGCLHRSTDGGRTWGPEERIWTNQSIQITAGHVLKRLSSGRLILPVERQMGQTWTKTDHFCSQPWYSDDDGRTWRPSDTVMDAGKRGLMETHVEELADGSLLAVMRTQLGAPYHARSQDGGSTWTPPTPLGVQAPESCPELVLRPGTDELALVWNDRPHDPSRSHGGPRSPLTVALSPDGGRSWTRRTNVETDPDWSFTNPTLLPIDTQTNLLTYWATDMRIPLMPRIDLRAIVFRWDELATS